MRRQNTIRIVFWRPFLIGHLVTLKDTSRTLLHTREIRSIDADHFSSHQGTCRVGVRSRRSQVAAEVQILHCRLAI